MRSWHEGAAIVVSRAAANGTGPAGAVTRDRGQSGSWIGLLVLALAWGSTFLWIDLALAEGIPPALLTFGRAVVATAVLLAIGWPKWRSWNGNGPRVRDLFLAAALCNAMPFLFFSHGQRTVVSGVAGVLNATTPLWAVLLEVVLSRGHRVGSRHLAGVALGFVGVCLVFAPWRDGVTWTTGVPLILLAAAGYAAGFALMTRRLIPTAASPRELAGLQMLAATVLLALPVPFEPVPSFPTAKGVLAVVMLGTLCTAFTFTIAYRMLATEGATRTAVVGYLIPVVAVLLGVVFLSEHVGPMTILGMLVVLAGVAWTRSQR